MSAVFSVHVHVHTCGIGTREIHMGTAPFESAPDLSPSLHSVELHWLSSPAAAGSAAGPHLLPGVDCSETSVAAPSWPPALLCPPPSSGSPVPSAGMGEAEKCGRI